jgi:hypothetical protein
MRQEIGMRVSGENERLVEGFSTVPMSPLQDYKDTTTDIGDIYGMTDTD